MITLNIKKDGEHVDIRFPCTEKVLTEALKTIGVNDEMDTKQIVSEVVDFESLSLLEGQEVDLDEINFLVKRLDSLTKTELDKFCVVSQMEGLDVPKDFINLTYNLNRYTLIQNVGDMHHRHVSHLYALYPADIITVESSGALAEACKRTLLRRGDDSTGWSTAWKMCLWAKLKEGDRVIKLLNDQLALVETTDGNEYYGKGGSFANLLCAPPFQIDGNFGLVAGMTLMFLQCEDGKLKILPALPKALPNGKIDGLLAKGSVKVDMAWQDGRLAYLALRSPFAQSVTVRYGERDIAVALKKDEKTVLINGVL